jgi:hypothetical protein
MMVLLSMAAFVAPQGSYLLGRVGYNPAQLHSLAPSNDIANALYTYDYQLLFAKK